MRIKAIDRIFLILTVLCVIAVSLLLLSVAWHFIDEDFVHSWVYNFYSVWENTLILSGIAALLLIMAIRLLYAGTTPYKKATKALVKKFEAGSVSISLDTIAEIAKRHALAIEGIKEVRCAIIPLEEGIRILYKIAVDEETVIPEKTQIIQTHVKERVEALTGASVMESSILVENPKAAPKKKTNAGEIL